MRYAVFGECAFNNQTRRDAVASRIKAEASERGFSEEGALGLPAGVVATSTSSFTLCYVHPEISAVESAVAELTEALSGNQYEGSFGYQAVPD